MCSVLGSHRRWAGGFRTLTRDRRTLGGVRAVEFLRMSALVFAKTSAGFWISFPSLWTGSAKSAQERARSSKGPKNIPRAAKSCQEVPESIPKASQERPKSVQRAGKSAKERPRAPESVPRASPERPRPPKSVPRASRERPKRGQDRPRARQESEVGAQDASRDVFL